MSRVCDLCGKGYLKGNLVCFSNKKSIKRSHVNLRSTKVSVLGVMKRMKICSGCLSASKRNAAIENLSQAETSQA